MYFLSSPAGAREEVFWSLAVSVVVLLMRRLLVRVFSGTWVVVLPWAEDGPMTGPSSRWTGIPQYPEYRQ
jgi:hypothetical protein